MNKCYEKIFTENAQDDYVTAVGKRLKLMSGQISLQILIWILPKISKYVAEGPDHM